MTGVIDWAASRARMVIAFVILSLTVGAAAYIGLPKEGEPDIDIPGLFVSVPFPGISAEDSERLLIRPMESEFQDLDGLTTITSTASEGFAGLFLEFEFGWDKSATIADVRDAMGRAEAEFPAGAESWQISEINFSEFPIIVVALSGDAPERTLIRLANEMQDALEGLSPVLEAGLAGTREEMLEVILDPLALEAYDVTAQDLINAVVNNNQLIAAGEVETSSGAISVKIPSSFDTAEDVYNLAITSNGDRVVTLGELADIRLTYQDRTGTARFNGETTVALQVVKRQGFNVMDTADLVRQTVEEVRASWPLELRDSVRVATTLDQSVQVEGMVRQLEGSVLTAIALVMIVVLAALGTRSAMLVGFAIPTSFLLCFILLGIMGIPISNIVMFGLILAVGMLVDGAIVVVEYADKRLSQGARPMQAYTDAAKRMFWPIVSSTATTLCAFLPMLFWPGVAGEFMGMLPVTLIFVLSASLIVALIYLPVLGGVAARWSRNRRPRVHRSEGAGALVCRAPRAGGGRGGRDVHGRDADDQSRRAVPPNRARNPAADGNAARCAPVRAGLRADVRGAGHAADRARRTCRCARATGARPSAGSSTCWSATRSCRLSSSPPSRLRRSASSPISAPTTTAWSSSSRPSPNRPSSMSARAATCRSRRWTRWCARPRRSC
jgi:multidrug efflux pump